MLAGQEKDVIVVTWHPEDCVLHGDANPEKTSIYTGCEGVMVPVITEAEKVKRREADRLRFREADERIAIVDGAVWIREQSALQFAERDEIGLDFDHLGANVYRARSSGKSRRKARPGPTS